MRDAIEAVESAVPGDVGLGGAEMPLAAHDGPITVIAQDFGERHGIALQVPLVGRSTQVRVHLADARLMGVESRHNRSA